MRKLINIVSVFTLFSTVALFAQGPGNGQPGGPGSGGGPGGGYHGGGQHGGSGHGPGGWAFMDQLTDDQRAELHDLVITMRANGATPDEIHTAVIALLTGWGIDVPDDFGQRPGFGGGHHGGPGHGPGGWAFMDQLTDDQRAELHDLVITMRANGATPDDIHAAVVALLTGWGIDIPDDFGQRPGFGGGPNCFSQLTDDQRDEVRLLISSMRADGALNDEIHNAVAALFTSWGLEPPDFCGPRKGRFGHRQLMNQLTDDQRAEVRQLVRTMRADGASRAEIRSAVNDLLISWGIDVPAPRSGDNMIRQKAGRQIKAHNYPNPFNPETQISYTIEQPGEVAVSIFNLNGQMIRTYNVGEKSAGTHSVKWNGELLNGNQAPSGIYFFRIQSGQEEITKSMLLLK